MCLRAGIPLKLCLRLCLLLLQCLLSGHCELLRLHLCCLVPSCGCLHVLIHCGHLCSSPLRCPGMGKCQQQS